MLKIRTSAIIMLGLPVPPPKPSHSGHNAPTIAEDVDIRDTEGTMWNKKVCDSCIQYYYGLYLHACCMKISLNDQLTPCHGGLSPRLCLPIFFPHTYSFPT